MATLEHTVNVIFGAQDSGLNSVTSSAIKNFDAFSFAVESVSVPVADLVRKLLELEAAAAVAGIAFLALAENTSGEFEDALKGLGALFNANKEQVDDLSNRILEFGLTAVSSYEDINKSAFIAISTGTDQAKVTEALAAAQKLAVAGSSELSDATAVLSRTMNAYGVETSKASEYADYLFIAAQQGDTNLTSLSSALGKVASTASAAKVPLQDLLAAVTTITLEGVSTDETMTKIKALILELASPGEALAKALGGVSLETDGLLAVMQKLQQVTGGSTSSMDALFSSSESLSAALILANDRSGKFVSTLGLMGSQAGIVEENFNKMAEGNYNLANVIEASLVKIGNAFQDPFDNVRNGISEILIAFSDSIEKEGLGKLQAVIADFANTAGDYLKGVAAALPAALESLNFDELIASLKALGGEFGKVFGDIFGDNLDLTKPEDLAIALQKAVNIATTLVRVTGAIIDEFKPVIDLIATAAGSTRNVSEEFVQTAGHLAAAITLLADFGTVLGSVLAAIPNATGAAQDTFDAFIGGVTLFAEGINQVFLSLQLLLARYIVSFKEGMAAVTFGDLSKGLQDDANLWKETIYGIETEIGKSGANIQDAWTKMKNGVSGANQEAARSTKEASKSIADDAALLASLASTDLTEWSDGMVLASDVTIDALNESTESTKKQINVTDLYAYKLGGLGETSSKTAEKVKKVSSETAKLSEEQKKAAENAFKLQETMLKLASDERIKAMEFTVDFKIAEVQAGAERVKAMFESLGESVKATAEATASEFSDLAAALGNKDVSGFDRLSLANYYEEQAARQQEALDIQKKATEAEIALNEEKLRVLQQGGGDIVIKADNLAPELRALMESFVRNVRIEASLEGLGVLLP